MEPTLGFQITWFAWAGGSIAAAVASGMFPGLLRGLVASLAVWTALTFAVYVAFGPSCPLEMSAAPFGTAAIGVLAADTFECAGASRWNNAGWFVLGGGFCTLLSLGGGLLGAAGRWAFGGRGPAPG